MTDDERAEYEAERKAYEKRRDEITAVRDALNIGDLETRLASMSSDLLTQDTRAWVDAIRAGASALRVPPEPAVKE